MQQNGDRRHDGVMQLEAPLAATIVFDLGGQEVEIDGRIVRATTHTVVVELASGARTLALAASPACELAVDVGGVTMRTSARPGRRVGDVPDPLQLELVLDEELDLGALLR